MFHFIYGVIILVLMVSAYFNNVRINELEDRLNQIEDKDQPWLEKETSGEIHE